MSLLEVSYPNHSLDHLAMLQYATYFVISPEGCASILWRDGTKAPVAAEALKITADSLIELGIIKLAVLDCKEAKGFVPLDGLSEYLCHLICEYVRFDDELLDDEIFCDAARR